MTGPGNKPLTSASFFVLLGLSSGPKHGVGIANDVAQRTDGGTELGPGSLYTALKRLLQSELVEEADAPPGADADPRRNYYRLTGSGHAALAAEARRLSQLVEITKDLRVLDTGARS